MARTKPPPKAIPRNMRQVLDIVSLFEEHYPEAKTELTYDGPFQLLVAVVLSAQCTDVRVNQVTPGLFAKYPTAEKLAKARQSDVEKIIHSCGFYRNKAKNIISASHDIVEKFGGEVPSTLDELVTLGGVGRKTASVVLNQAFDEPAIAVDTHVLRVANRLGWANSENPVKVEMQLRELLPKEVWSTVNGMLILHGRRLCKARKPLCEKCFLQDVCPYYKSMKRLD